MEITIADNSELKRGDEAEDVGIATLVNICTHIRILT
jgi:hypothetical protein